jgi:hypothetical protein
MVRRARGTVFWLGMNQEIRQLADNCEHCMERNVLEKKFRKSPCGNMMTATTTGRKLG